MFSIFKIRKAEGRKKDLLLDLSKSTALLEKATNELEEVLEELRDSIHKDTNIILKVFRTIGDFFEKPVILVDNKGYPIYYNSFAKEIFYPNFLDNINIFSLIFGKKNPTRQEINQNSNINNKIKIQLSEKNILECKVNYFSIISDHKINYLVFIEDEKETKLSERLDNFHSINFLFRKVFSRNKRFAICAFFANEENFLNFETLSSKKEDEINEIKESIYKTSKQKLIYFNSTFIEKFHHLIGNNFCFDKLFDCSHDSYVSEPNNGISDIKSTSLENVKKIVNTKSYYQGVLNVSYLKNENENKNYPKLSSNNNINNDNLSKKEILVTEPLHVYIASVRTKNELILKNSNIIEKNQNNINNNEKLYFCVIEFNKDNKDEYYNHDNNDIFSIMISSGILSNWTYNKEKKSFSINLNDPIFSMNVPFFIALIKFLKFYKESSNCEQNHDDINDINKNYDKKLIKEIEQIIFFFEDNQKIYTDINIDLTELDFLKKQNTTNLNEEIIFDEYQNNERFKQFIKFFEEQEKSLITKNIRFVKIFENKKIIKGICFPIMIQ